MLSLIETNEIYESSDQYNMWDQVGLYITPELEKEYIERAGDPERINTASIDDLINSDEDKLMGLSMVVCEDYEIEKEYIRFVLEQSENPAIPTTEVAITEVDDGLSMEHASAYWTQSGDNPICWDAATLNDQRDRNLNEVLPPEKTFYSVAKLRFPRSEWVIQYRNYTTIGVFIFRNKDNKELLRRALKRMWKRYYDVYRGNGKANTFLWKRQLNNLVKAFNRYM